VDYEKLKTAVFGTGFMGRVHSEESGGWEMSKWRRSRLERRKGQEVRR
jgi:hypothetical protein